MTTDNDFNGLLQVVKDGEPVAAGVTNRAVLQLDSRTRYLLDKILGANLGSAVVVRHVPVEPGALVGQPVYYNAGRGRYERAIAGVQFDAASATLMATEASQVWGVVSAKPTAGSADVLFFGYAKLDVSAALEAPGPVTAGTYYLSRTTPGLMSNVRPPVPIPVLRADGAGNVFVNPRWDELPAGHSHLNFVLKAAPAGAHATPAAGAHHVIEGPNPAAQGWLPADHASFGGLAPTGAKFGYNLAADPPLKAAWPPLPPEGALLVSDGIQLPSGPGGIVVFDHNGIWWMSDCYDDAPWPTQLETDAGGAPVGEWSESLSGQDVGSCPFPYPARLDLSFARFSFMNESSVVTSVRSTDPRVVIECDGSPGQAAHVGPLVVSLDLAFAADQVDPGGHVAVKGFDPVLGVMHFGEVATGVYARGTNLQLVSDFTTLEQVDAAPAARTTVHHGRVGVAVTTSVNRELFPDLVRLDGATEEYFEDVMYLAFAQGRLQAIRVRFPVPETLDVTGGTTFQLRLRVFGTTAGVLPSLGLTARRIPASSDAAATLPPADSGLSIVTDATLPGPNQYVDVLSDPFSVVAGDDLLFTITRSDTDSYPGEVGILRVAGLIAAAG